MEEKWIGEQDDTSGSYFETKCKELKRRTGGRINSKKLYKFNSRFDKEYYITDEEAIRKIEEILEKDEKPYEYLYNLVIKEFGVMEFIVDIGHKIAKERDYGYREGKKQMRKEMRKLLGL